MCPFNARPILLIVDFVLKKPLSISINFDALLLLILAACLVIARRCLLCSRFLMDWCNFTANFIFIYLLISAGYLFCRKKIGFLVRFRLFFIDLCLACGIMFDCCVWCSCYCTFCLHEIFTFWLLSFRVRFLVSFGFCRALWPIYSHHHSHGLGALQISGWLYFS